MLSPAPRARRSAQVESIAVDVRLSGPGGAQPGATLAWGFGAASGTLALGADPAKLTVAAPAAGTIAILPLVLEAKGADGRLLSRNTLEFCIVPPLGGEAPAFSPMDALAARTLEALGWPRRANEPGETGVLLATRLATPAREAMIAGRKVVLIANTDDALTDPERKLPASDRHNFPQMLLRRREGTPWDGQWMGAFTWRRTDGAWAALPNGPMLDEHWQGLIPNHVLTGFLSPAFNGLVASGMAVGWLHHAAAFVKKSFLGSGWLTVSTYDLTSGEAASNPLAPYVLAAIAQS